MNFPSLLKSAVFLLFFLFLFFFFWVKSERGSRTTPRQRTLIIGVHLF